MPEVFSLEKWEKESAQLAAEWKQPTVGAPAEEEFRFDVGNTKSRPVTKGGEDIFQTDEYGVQYFTFEGWKEHQEAATAWMELAGQAFHHMAGGFTRDLVKYDPERHGTGAFSLQMGSDRIVAGGEAGLRAADGIWDFVKGGAKFAQRPFQSEEKVDRVKYRQYLELTAKMNGLYGVWKKDGQLVPPGTEGAMKVKSPESFAGNIRRAWSGEGDKGAAAIDEMIDPQAADSWSMVLDPVWLIPGGGLAKVQKVLATGAKGAKLAAALKKIKNLAPQGGKLSAAAQWAKDAAKVTAPVIRNPATRAVGGAGRLVAGAGSALEYAGSKMGNYPKIAFGVGAYYGYGAIEDDRGLVDILAAVGAGVATAKAMPVVLAKKGAALRGVGEFTRGTAKVAEVGTFGRAVQSGMYSAGTNKALKFMDNAPLNAIAHRSGQLANLIAKGSVFGAGMGYVIAGKEGAAAGLGVGVLGAPIGALQARAISGAMKFPFYKKNKDGKWEKTEANNILDVPHPDLVDNFLGHMSKGDRESLLTSGIDQSKLYGMALLDAYAKGILKKGKDGAEGDLVIRYMDDADIMAEFPNQTEWIGKQGIHRADVDGKPLIIINRSHSVDQLRTLAHEIFHPDWKTADGNDPLTGLRAEMQTHLFGIRDGADGVIVDGLFNEKEFLSLENQYLSRLYGKDKKGKEGYKKHIDENNMQQRREYIAGEVLSESFGNFAEAAGGDVVAHGRRILRGAKLDKVTEFVTGGLATKFDLGLLGRMRQALEKMGIEFDSAGEPVSSIFRDPSTGKRKSRMQDGKRVYFKEGGEGLTNSPEMNKLIADYVVGKDKVLERLTIRTEGKDEKVVITAKQILEKNDPVLVQKFANSGMFKVDNDGNVVFEGGAPVLLSRKERKLVEQTQSDAIFAQLDAVARVEFDADGLVRKENDKGDVSYSGRFMNEEQLSAVLSLPDEVLPRSVKNKISKLNEMMTKGFDDAGNLVGDHSPNFLIQYYAATKGSKYTSKASMSHQLAAPYGWSISQAGNFNLQTLSVGRLEAKIAKWWKKAEGARGGRHRAFTELFDGSKEQFRGDVIEYLNNQAAGIKNPDSAKKDAIADFLNALPKEQKDAMPNRLSTDSEHVVPVSLRVDRMESIQSSLGTPMPVNYAKLVKNYMPAGKKPTAPKGDEGGAQYMPAAGGAKVARVTGKDTVVLDKDFSVQFMPSPVAPNAVLKDFHKKRVQILTTDLSVAGDKAVDGVVIKFGGGPGHLGWHDGWGYTGKQNADAFGTRWRNAGEPLIGLTSLSPNNHLNQPLAREYYTAKWREVIENGLISERQVNKHVREVIDRLVKSEATGVGALPDKIKAQLAKVKTFKQFSKIFHDPKVIPWTHAAKIYKKLDAKTLPISHAEQVKLGTDLDSVAHATRQPEYHEAPVGSLLAIAEYDGTPATFRPDLNVAYPWFVPLKEKAFLKGIHDVRKLSTDKDLLTPKGKVNTGTMMGKGIILDKLAKGDVQYMPAGKSGGEVFYSNSAKALESPKVPKAANGPAMLNAMIKGGANLQEMKWMGLDQFLMDHKGKVTKERVRDFIDTNQIQVMEKVRGGKEGESIRRAKREADLAEEDMFAAQERGTPEDFRAAKEKYERLQKEFVMLTKDIGTKHGGGELVLPGAKKGSYRELELMLPRNKGEKFIGPEAHWGKDENVFASVRFNERTDADGKRMLFIEEVQSDWAAGGREQGFKSEAELRAGKAALLEAGDYRKYLVKKYGTSEIHSLITREEQVKLDALVVAAPTISLRSGSNAPAAPFVSKRKGGKVVEDAGWRALAFKRILRWAADEGFSRVGWISGTDTAKRYDLSRTLNSVEWQRMPGEDTVHITALDKEGKAVISDRPVNIRKLKSTVGRELSEKILASDKLSGEFTGLELEVGGEGHKQFYDVDLPNYVRKYVKTWGGEVGKVGISGLIESHPMDPVPYETIRSTAHYTDITPSMKKSVVEGQAMFMPAGRKGLIKAFHGSPAKQIGKFDSSKIGSNVDPGMQGEGFYFAPSSKGAKVYGENVESYLIKLENPYIHQDSFYSLTEKLNKSPKELTQWLKGKGHDGVIAKDGEGNILEYLVFDSKNVNSKGKSEKPSADKQLRIERDLKKKSDDVRYMPAGDVKRMVERFDIDNLKDAYDKLADDRTHGNEDLAGAAHQAWDELFPSGVNSAIVTKATASRAVDMSAKDVRQSMLEDYVSRVIEITKGIDTDRAKVELRLERDLKKLKRK